MRANILITGGLGTIGRGLTEECRKRGHSVMTCDLYHHADEVGFSLRADVPSPLTHVVILVSFAKLKGSSTD